MSKSITHILNGYKYSYSISNAKFKSGEAALQITVFLYPKDVIGNDSKKRKKIRNSLIPIDYESPEDAAIGLIEEYHREKIELADLSVPYTYAQCNFQNYVSNRAYLRELQQLRGWNQEDYSTASAYENALVNQWGAAFNSNIPFYKIKKQDCDEALECLKRNSGALSAERCEWLCNVLRQLMTYAVSKRHRERNPMIDGKRTETMNDETKKIVKRHRLYSNTLTHDEMKALFEMIEDNYIADGTWLAVGRMLFTGVRTAESCAGFFEDFIEMRDYPNEYYIRVFRQQRKDGAEPDISLKSQNAYRNTPVISALAKLIKNKMKDVQSHISPSEDITKYPIACKEVDYKCLCTKSDVNSCVAKWVNKNGIMLGKDMFNAVMADEDDDIDTKSTATAYTLRRNAYTMMTSLAAMTEEEAAYIIGHSNLQFDTTQQKMYRTFSSEDCLHDILGKLNRIAYWMDLYAGDTIHLPQGPGTVQLKEKDNSTIESELGEDEFLHLIVQTYEAGDPIRFEIKADADLELEKSSITGLRHNTRKVVIYSGMKKYAKVVIGKRSKYQRKAPIVLSTSDDATPTLSSQLIDGSIPVGEAAVEHEKESAGQSVNKAVTGAAAACSVIVITEKGFANKVDLNQLSPQELGTIGQFIIRPDGNDAVAAAVTVRDNDKLLLITRDGRAIIAEANEVASLNWQKNGMSMQRKCQEKVYPIALPESERQFVTAAVLPTQWEKSLALVVVTTDAEIRKIPLASLMYLLSGEEDVCDLIPSVTTKSVAAAFMIDDKADPAQRVYLLTNHGKMICISIKYVPLLSKQAVWECGIKLDQGELCVDACPFTKQKEMVTVTKEGYGKISQTERILGKKTGWGKKSIIQPYAIGEEGISVHRHNSSKGDLCKCLPVHFGKGDIVLITTIGKAVRLPMDGNDMRISGLNTEGRHFQEMECNQVSSNNSTNYVRCLLYCEAD